MKNKVLIIFKYHRNWNSNIISKFSNFYETEHLYINDFKNKNFTEIILDINKLIKEKNINIVVFDVDYFKFINFFFIERINSKIKLLWTGDDFELHDINSVTASACDLILSHCAFSVLKYKEKGHNAFLLHGENGKINTKDNIKKDIDILFFGHITPDRKEFLNHISNSGLVIKNVGHEKHVIGLSNEDLADLISRTKIVINFSKSRTTLVSNYSSEKIYKFYYQFKGRIMLAGLNGAACVSEYSPAQELLFKNDEIPTFFTKEECVDTLKKLLNDNELLSKYTSKFTFRVKELCEDKKNFEPIFNAIERSDFKKVPLLKIPYWYLRIAAKQILLRNAKLSNFMNTMLQFGVISKVIKNSSFFIKLLIILESIINILWYLFILNFKSKK